MSVCEGYKGRPGGDVCLAPDVPVARGNLWLFSPLLLRPDVCKLFAPILLQQGLSQ